ncbi:MULTISPECIES: LLM class flavin-dependent oxidoreductase [unclassified Achromobacter]|uniref:LLM class flavin-dependent oxidoreductase n=1 Tax=unclassified Achromobacter TaxID=2626865 RepID=UPI001303392D|nr:MULTISPECIES: LLM class flavin-dependent oxidoreductase [unclassified Achromobacter]
MTQTSSFHFGLGLNAAAHHGHAAHPVLHWERAILDADAAGVDFVTLDDRAGRASGPGQTPLDAILLAARVAPLTRHLGILPGVVVPLNEPFHVSTALATLDYVTGGRAGLLALVPDTGHAAAVAQLAGAGLPGFPVPRGDALYADADDALQAIRLLWDSWEDGAIIRDAASGRFIDRDKLHYIDFQGAGWSIRGPSIVPRPPQGQPPVAIAVRSEADGAWAARHADIAFIPIDGDNSAQAALRARLSAARQLAGAALAPLRLYADLVFSLDPLVEEDSWEQDAHGTYYAGTPDTLAARIVDLRARGYDGVRVHPRNLTRDLAAIDEALLPRLRDAGLLSGNSATPPKSLRQRLGLAPALNRYRDISQTGLPTSAAAGSTGEWQGAQQS